MSRLIKFAACLAFCAGTTETSAGKELLNVSYDPTREVFQEVNASFLQHWQKKSLEPLVIHQSHGGSGKQARAVIDGLEADVVTLAIAYDIDAIAGKNIIKADWQKQLPNNSAPFTSTVVFLVRKGNPKNINDWQDLVRDDVGVIVPNPKTSGVARLIYLAAWGYNLKKPGGSEAKALEFVGRLFKNVKVLDSGSRGATTTFAERGIGDALITWENEAYMVIKEFGAERFAIVSPSISILAEPAVSVVDKVVDKKGTRQEAEAYLKYLYSDEAQEIIAKYHYRPRSQKIMQKYASSFSRMELFSIDDVFGGWNKAQKTHFDDGGTFDKIFIKNR
ncbi:MAG: sulfate ABC transporter substrate-binding protein [Oligoflexales bacterium]|nr:sulfate ABC transporter substrate-binding protein [Oligoflexales bacterium]